MKATAAMKVLAYFIIGSILPHAHAQIDPRPFDCAEAYLGKKTAAEIKDVLQQIDLANYSIRTTLYGQDAYQGLPEGSIEAGSLSGNAANIFQRFTLQSPWAASLVPFESYRRVAFDRLPLLFRDAWPYGGSLATALQTPLSQFSGNFDLHTLEMYVKNRKKLKQDITPPEAVLIALCGTYGNVLESVVCAKALRQILSDMSPSGQTLLLIDEFHSFFRSDSYVEPLRNFSRYLFNLVNSGELPTGTLFEDLQSEFLRTGFSETEAYEATWTFLGLEGTSGPNIGTRLIPFPHQGTSRQLYPMLFSIISMGTAVLNARTLAKEGRFYSFPRNVVSEIENSKPYYFWESAYLAWKSARSVGNANAAANAAWLAQIGYQVRASGTGRDPKRAFIVESFSPANNKIRLDLAYAANGAVFGANSVHRLSDRKFNVDETLKELILAGEALEPLSPEKASTLFSGTGFEAWQRWRRIFGPDQAIKRAKRNEN